MEQVAIELYKLYYLESRYYDPETGRFISADVYLTTGQSVIGHNAYAYCGNNPINRKDSAGTLFFTAIGALVGGVIGGLSAMFNGEDIIAGAAGGAVTGGIMGALTDVTVVTGGAAAPVAAVVVGAVAGGAGDFTTQVVGNMNKGHSLQESVRQVDWASVNVSAFCGAVAGGISHYIGNAIKQTIFEPVRKSVVNNAVRYAFNETTEFTWGPIIRSATYSGLCQLGSEAAISVGQTSLYFYINRWIHSIN